MPGLFLAYNSGELTEQRTVVLNTLLKAGLQAYPSDVSYSAQSHPLQDSIEQADLSLHIMGLSYTPMAGDGKSLEQLQYEEALKKLQREPDFRVFVWFPYNVQDIQDDKQRNFISQIRNSITEGINFSNIGSAIQLADDLRLNMKRREKTDFDVKSTDVFLVYNQLDDNEASEVVDMLSDIIPVEKLNIIQDSDVDYSELCAQQISKSKLAVVYFKESADWALPFTQQIWKKIGGASSHTPILLIGDEDPDSNATKKFKAPKVVSLIVSGELIPLEIKVQYDKVIEANP
ncbi:MAG TPA: hypothetical protein PLQ93_12980 [Bacteroidia bacterium]|nr:hypothetical protein [Bacteroidia bacterium]